MSSIEPKIIDKVEDIEEIKKYVVSNEDRIIKKLYIVNQLDDVYKNVNKIISDFVLHIKSDKMTYLFIDNIESLYSVPLAPAHAQSDAGDKYYYKYLKYKNKYLNYKI